MPVRSYSGAAKATTLSGAVSAGATVINVVDATGWPTGAAGPFVITIDAGVTTEEKVLVSGRTGNSLTVSARGFDDTTASDHGNAARVEHTLSATDIREANAHVNDTSGDPHPQYLTPAEGAALYPTLTHGHAYSNLDHSHTYDSITLKPTIGLLAVANFNITVSSSTTPTVGPALTATVPASGKVLLRVSGAVRVTSGTVPQFVDCYLRLDGTNATGFAPVRVTVASDAVFITLPLARTLTAGATISVAPVLGILNSGAAEWAGTTEVWAAP